eukprot:m51a1_g7865 putative fatty acid elongase 3-ketoacyl- synthase (561) ;mRNA; f:267176-269075
MSAEPHPTEQPQEPAPAEAPAAEAAAEAPAAQAPAPEAAAPAAAAAAGAGKPQHKDDGPLKSYWYPDRSGDMREVARGFGDTVFALIPWSTYVLGIVLVAALAVAARNHSVTRVVRALAAETATGGQEGAVGLAAVGLALALGAYMVSLAFFTLYRMPVYLLDFNVYQPPDQYKVNPKQFIDISRSTGKFNEESLAFQARLIERTGLGLETYLPAAMHADPPDPSMARAREEALEVIAGCCDPLFKRTGVRPSEVDVVIVNCSLFCPTPSLSAMIVNHYKMRKDVKNYNLGGMGCSAGAVSIDLAKDLLQSARYRNKNVLVFSTENITMNWYLGDQKGMLISNTLFRMGGAAILLTNKPSLAGRAKYRLRSTVRVITACDDAAHNAIVQMEDKDGRRGVRISKELVKAVGQALKTNLTMLGPQVLPYSEQARFLWDLALRTVWPAYRRAHPERYMPDFRKAFQHYCIHAGGRAIIDGLEENLKLSQRDVMPSRATLFRYGNTSSSSVWYELNYIEGRGGVARGDRIWQIAFGSGLKCNSVVWEALVPFAKSDSVPDVLSS